MSKKKPESSAPVSSDSARILPFAPVLLVALSAGMSLLALFQWMELLVVRAGGSTVCGVNEVVNCQKVWDTDFAASIHNTLGIPVAGLGLVWGLTALVLSLAWTHQLLSGRSGAAQATGLKLLAIAGVISIVVFGAVSFNAGAVCLTCVATYALVLVFALVVWRLMPPPLLPATGAHWQGGLVWCVAAAVVSYLVLLGPGHATPHANDGGSSLLKKVAKANAAQTSTPAPAKDSGTSSASATTPPPALQRPLTPGEKNVAELLTALEPQEKQLFANFLAMYRAKLSEKAPAPVPAARELMGAKDAPVKLVEWVDIRCPHCRALNDAMHQILHVAPEGLVSVEARGYPLAQECNPNVQRPDPTNVSCTAAKALVCLEGKPTFWKVRDALFEAQQSLTSVDRVMEIATQNGASRGELDHCIQSAATTKKLSDDVSYAMKYDPSGTPILTLNGRVVTPYPPLVYALVMTQGDASSPVFSSLPSADLSQMGEE